MPRSMIACYLSNQVAEEIEIEGLEESSDLHLTLVFLGEIDSNLIDLIAEIIEDWAELTPPITGTLGALSRFPASESSDSMDVAYYPFQSAQLDQLREVLLRDLRDAGLAHVSEFEYTPHVTVGYIPPGSLLPDVEYQSISIAFDSVSFCIGKLRADFPLMGAIEIEDESSDTEGDDSEEDTSADDYPSRFFVGSMSTKYRQIAPSNTVPRMYWGAPSPNELSRINAITGQEWAETDWQIVPFRASDNLLWRSKGKWHEQVLSQMPSQLVGKPIIFDHNWYNVQDSCGIVIDAFVSVEPSPPQEFERDRSINKSIIQKEKYRSVYVVAAFPAEMQAIIQGLKTKLYNNVSTGSNIHQASIICPHCSEQYGFDVDVRLVDEHDRWVCPHLPPDCEGMDTDKPVMKYVVYNGIYDGVELSLCLAGNLPLAGAIR